MEVTLEKIALALIVIKRDLDDLKPIPVSGPLTWSQAERLVESDPQMQITIEGNQIKFARDSPFGPQVWHRPYARERIEFPLYLNP